MDNFINILVAGIFLLCSINLYVLVFNNSTMGEKKSEEQYMIQQVLTFVTSFCCIAAFVFLTLQFIGIFV